MQEPYYHTFYEASPQSYQQHKPSIHSQHHKACPYLQAQAVRSQMLGSGAAIRRKMDMHWNQVF